MCVVLCITAGKQTQCENNIITINWQHFLKTQTKTVAGKLTFTKTMTKLHKYIYTHN